MKKKLLCALLVLAITISALCIVPIQADAANSNTIIMRLNSTSAFLNRSKIAVDPSNPDVSPFTLNSKTMVPVRFVQQLGADVKYTSVNEPVTVTYGEIVLSLSFGKSEMHKVVAEEHAGIIDLPTPPTLVEGKTCVPIREIAEALGFSVNYNPGNFVIVVSTAVLAASQLDSEMKYGADNLPTTVTGVKSITAKNNARSIAVGGSVQLSAADITFDPAQAGCQLLLYSTSDPDTATVTSQGKVIGVSDGAANITITSHNGKTTMIRVTVGTGIPSGKTFELLDVKFVPFANAVLPSPLNNADSYPVSFKCDLNGNGKEDDITIDVGEPDSYEDVIIRMKVNGTSFDITTQGLEGIYLVDIDITDSYKEIAICCDWLTDNDRTGLFRYDGSRFIDLGSIGIRCSWWERPYDVMTDLKGTLIDSSYFGCNVIEFTDPPIALSYHKLSGNKLSKITTDSASILGKKFPISLQGFSGYSFNSDEHPDVREDLDDVKHNVFKPDDEITILAIGEGTSYYVQISGVDGVRKGVLWFPLAG